MAPVPPVQPVPPAAGGIPYLTIRGAEDAIGFYQRVFGAEVALRLDEPNGRVLHCQLKVGPASFMLTEERPQMGALSPLTIGGSSTTVTLYFPDCDAVIARALAAGAKPQMPLMDQFWGDRAGGIVDPFGHQWLIATHKEDPTPAQLNERLQAMMSPGGACPEGGQPG
ncbi:MAG: VOC family protein [Burkholderiaceae bacterium]